MSSSSHSGGLVHARDAAVRPSFRLKILLAAMVLLAGGVALFHSGFEWQDLPALLERVNRPLALALMAVLPIVGFPISAVYLAAGALFGPWIGVLVVTGATAIHLLATHGLARKLLRRRIERLQEKWRHRLPRLSGANEYATLIAMVVIVPGPPYFVRNGVLALSGAPLRYLLGVGVPLYVARSCVTIFLGDLGSDPSPRALAILGIVFVTKLAISGLLFQRLRHRGQRA
jgi:uncharacterized membrane protein YdjX (TVP38/TMEM64 family)